MWTCATSAPTAVRPFKILYGLDDAAAEAGADDRGDRGVPRGLRAEADVMRVEGGGVAVVVVDDGQPQLRLEGAAEVEPAPALVREVRGAHRRDDAVGAGRTRRVEADRPHARAPGARALEDGAEGPDASLARHRGAPRVAAGRLCASAPH